MPQLADHEFVAFIGDCDAGCHDYYKCEACGAIIPVIHALRTLTDERLKLAGSYLAILETAYDTQRQRRRVLQRKLVDRHGWTKQEAEAAWYTLQQTSHPARVVENKP